jgi:2-methylcitrate dehydratase PrpD
VAGVTSNDPENAGLLQALLVAEATKVKYGAASSGELAALRLALLDWLGVTIAGSAEPSARIAQRLVVAEGSAQSSRVLGTHITGSPRQAALANGIAGHALDFDDMGLGGTHPSVAIVPAVFALAEELNLTGPQLAEGLLAGYQGMALVSYAAGWSAYQRGFHATGTVGTYGAALGCGRLLNFEPDEYQRAIGTASTLAAGIKASFGSMAKHLNAGNAASNGVLAALLASQGFTAADDGISGHQGFIAAHSDPNDFHPERGLEVLGDQNAVTQIMFKVHASCGGTHAAIESVRAALQGHAATLDEIAEVRATVSDVLPDMCGIPEPRTGLEGKFSLRHAIGLALQGASTGPAGFTDEAVNDPTNVAARRLVTIIPSAALAVDGPAEVDVELKDGTTFSASVNPYVPIPTDQIAGRLPEFVDKFVGLVAPILGVGQAEDLVQTVLAFDELDDVGQLAAASAVT